MFEIIIVIVIYWRCIVIYVVGFVLSDLYILFELIFKINLLIGIINILNL